MGNFKIKVNSANESKEAQELFFKSGGKWCLGGCKIKNTDEPYLYLENGLVLHGSSAETFNTEQHKEVTLPELRAMVVLNRNDVNDATHEDEFFKYLELGDGRYYFKEKWIKSSGEKPEYYNGLREINTGATSTEQHEQPSLNDQYAEIEQVRQASKDNVNNPQHYNKGGVECIDAIEASMTPEAFKGYLKGNVQKYMWRYEQKGGVESLRKAQWYLERLVVSMDS